jgi:hypothetical protein
MPYQLLFPQTEHKFEHGKTSNVQTKRLEILIRIKEVPGSNLGPETGYPD